VLRLWMGACCAVCGVWGASRLQVDDLEYLIVNFINETGLSMLEVCCIESLLCLPSAVQTDGPYGGDECFSTTHDHHNDAGDSIYRQTQMQAQFYTAMRERNVFINQPDMYFYQGGSKTGMGYNEVLPSHLVLCSSVTAARTSTVCLAGRTSR
jgi:hypothetical protein